MTRIDGTIDRFIIHRQFVNDASIRTGSLPRVLACISARGGRNAFLRLAHRLVICLFSSSVHFFTATDLRDMKENDKPVLLMSDDCTACLDLSSLSVSQY